MMWSGLFPTQTISAEPQLSPDFTPSVSVDSIRVPRDIALHCHYIANVTTSAILNVAASNERLPSKQRSMEMQ